MNDLRFAFRQLRKTPGFTIVAILTLALGIGANTAIFSVVHAVLLAPLPYPEANQLVTVQSQNVKQNLQGQGFAPAGFREFEKQTTSFEAVAGGRYNYVNLTRVEKPTQLTDGIVTHRYFDVLGVKPLIGRTFSAEDAAGGAKPTVVLTYKLWQSHFGGRHTLIGEDIMLDDVPHTVIGVMPRDFKEPYNISTCFRVFPAEGGENLTANARFWSVIGRLKADVPAETVKAELATIASRFAQSDPRFYNDWQFIARPLRDSVVGNYSSGLLLVIGAALLVLLITCANVAGLQLVRASTRQREVAVRLALGASRGAIARSHLVESLLLVAFGGLAGVLLGSWGLDLLLASFDSDWIPRSDEIGINTPVLLGTGAVALLTGLLFGMYPAWQATKVDAIDSLRDGSKGSSGPQSVRLRGALVVGQIGLTVVLLVCAGLVWKSFANIMAVNPGMRVDGTLSMVISLATVRYDTPEKRIEYYRQIEERVRAIPGVEAAAFTQTMPFTWGIPAAFKIEGSADDDAVKLPSAFYDSVTPSYFNAIGIPLLAGRGFTESDDRNAPRVVVVSKATAAKFFPGENPIGRRLILPAATGQAQRPQPLEIIGVVGDVPRSGLDAETPYQVYASMNQRGWAFATLLVRSRLPVEALTKTVQSEIWKLNPEQPITNVAPVRDLVRTSLTQPTLYLTLFSLFAALALVLAVLGLYGLIAYSVAQRTREFGIRIALGAQAQDVLRLVIHQGVRFTAAGLVVGLFAAAAAARLMQALLFKTTAYDPFVFSTVLLVLGAIAFLASLLPARRATKADPVLALRSE
jgi:putative ABC transport system permease protein